MELPTWSLLIPIAVISFIVAWASDGYTYTYVLVFNLCFAGVVGVIYAYTPITMYINARKSEHLNKQIPLKEGR